MTTVHVEFDVDVPVDCDIEDVDEWLRFSFGERGSMSTENSLHEHEPEAIFGTLDWDYT